MKSAKTVRVRPAPQRLAPCTRAAGCGEAGTPRTTTIMAEQECFTGDPSRCRRCCLGLWGAGCQRHLTQHHARPEGTGFPQRLPSRIPTQTAAGVVGAAGTPGWHLAGFAGPSSWTRASSRGSSSRLGPTSTPSSMTLHTSTPHLHAAGAPKLPGGSGKIWGPWRAPEPA